MTEIDTTYKDCSNCKWKKPNITWRECRCKCSYRFDKQKQDCFEQLKREKRNAQDTYDMWKASLESIEILRKENKELKQLKDKFYLQTLTDEKTISDLLTALEKIKNVVSICLEFRLCNNCSFFSECNGYMENYILKIISGEE